MNLQENEFYIIYYIVIFITSDKYNIFKRENIIGIDSTQYSVEIYVWLCCNSMSWTVVLINYSNFLGSLYNIRKDDSSILHQTNMQGLQMKDTLLL